MKWIVLVLCVPIGVAIGDLTYHAGRASIVRECPAAQHGAKLLHSEQRPTYTVCTYASGWDGYGKTIKKRKVGNAIIHWPRSGSAGIGVAIP